MKDFYLWLMIAISVTILLIPLAICGEQEYQCAKKNLPTLEARVSNMSTTIDGISARINSLTSNE